MKHDSIVDKSPIYERLDREYEAKFAELGASFEAGVSGVDIQANVVFEGPKGPRWTYTVWYAEPNKRGIPPYKQLMAIEEAERLLRERLDDLIEHLWVVFRDAPWDHQPSQPDFKRKLSIQQAAEESGLSVQYLRRAITTGRLEATNDGGRFLLVSPKAVEHFLAARRKRRPRPKS